MIAFFHDGLAVETFTNLCGLGMVEIARTGFAFDLDLKPAVLVRMVIQEFYSVSEEEILGRSRVARIAWARLTAMALIREFLPTLSHQQVAEELKRANYASSIRASLRVQDSEDLFNETAGELREIRRRIKEALDIRRALIRELSMEGGVL